MSCESILLYTSDVPFWSYEQNVVIGHPQLLNILIQGVSEEKQPLKAPSF